MNTNWKLQRWTLVANKYFWKRRVSLFSIQSVRTRKSFFHFVIASSLDAFLTTTALLILFQFSLCSAVDRTILRISQRQAMLVSRGMPSTVLSILPLTPSLQPAVTQRNNNFITFCSEGRHLFINFWIESVLSSLLISSTWANAAAADRGYPPQLGILPNSIHWMRWGNPPQQHTLSYLHSEFSDY